MVPTAVRFSRSRLSRVNPNPRGPSALNGGRGQYSGAPYDAADLYGQHMAAWTPALWSPDGELNPYRDRIVSRVRDMVRNDGWASGSVTRILDNAIGPNLRPIAKPDHKYLAHYTGNPAFDAVWAKEFARAADANWRSWAQDTGCTGADASRNNSFSQMMRVAFRHKLVDGDALAILQWASEAASAAAAPATAPRSKSSIPTGSRTRSRTSTSRSCAAASRSSRRPAPPSPITSARPTPATGSTLRSP